MLIIAAGAIIAVGILQLGVQSKRTGIAQNSAIDAYEVQIRNKAFTAAQVSMERINESGGTWHPTSTSPWTQEIDGDSISLYYELKPSSGGGSYAILESDTVEIHARSWYRDPINGQERDLDIITSYVKQALHFVPDFQSAISIAADYDDFVFSAQGSSLISGDDNSGTCPAKPAVSVKDQQSYDAISGDADTYSRLVGEGGELVLDEDLSYQPVDQLVARLAQMDGVKRIPDGVYKEDLGTADSPGVFFVEGDTKFASNTEGFGIMVVRNYGTVSGDTTGGSLIDEITGSLDLKGGFTFNGLVIFENAYNMDGKGTVNINGSVLVGKTDDSYDDIDIDLNGNITVSYDCKAEETAKAAAAGMLNQNRYKRLSTYE